MTVLAPWDPSFKAKAGPRLVWVSWEYLWPRPWEGAGVPREGAEAPGIHLSCLWHRGPAVRQAPPSQAGLCVIPHSGHCMRQRQAGTSGPGPQQQGIRTESTCPGTQVLCLVPQAPEVPCVSSSGNQCGPRWCGNPSPLPYWLFLPRAPSDGP